MTRALLDRELDTVATWWRIWRRDGVAIAFTTHDRDLWFGGLNHRAAPGLTPAAIRLSGSVSDDGTDVEGALAHDCISEVDLAAGRYDNATVEIGAVCWETLKSRTLYRGTIETVGRDGNAFSAALVSAKAALAVDSVPRSSPTCRARFCDRGCGLSPARYTHRAAVVATAGERLSFDVDDPALFASGELRWLDGPRAGLAAQIAAADESGFAVDGRLGGIAPGTRALLREGCSHTVVTCGGRFGNAANFQGEPFLPGTDLLAHYPMPR